MNLKRLNIIAFLLLLFNCTEPFTVVTENFEDVLVVEATITDELKTQEIKLSRTIALEEGSEPNYVTSAQVSIEGSNSMVYNFEHTAYGVYESVIPFQAEQGVSYQLKIVVNGKKYNSTIQILPPKVEIEQVYAELIEIEKGVGVQVFVDSETTPQNANYFRYEYEETYQIIARNYFPLDLRLEPEDWASDADAGFLCSKLPVWVLRPQNERICYLDDVSNDIFITSINGVNESRVLKYPIRFIKADDHLIRDRYSILVKQFVQSADANNFYRILKELGDDESLLIDNQPGFVQGNIFYEENKNEKVIGFFEVSSMSTKRLFFDYKDFEIERKPRYPFECEIREFNFLATGPPSSEQDERASLYNLLSNFGYKFYGQDMCNILITNKECGDCTSFASAEKPLFWED